MELHCTRPGCPRPVNIFPDLDQQTNLRTVQQKFCTTCGMPLILDGRYIALRRLAQGGFGAAFLACDRRIPTLPKCVVKLFLPPHDLNAEQLQVAQGLFEREGEVLAELGSHPQIPDLLAFFSLTVPGLSPGTQSEFFYLVQEFIDGDTLERELVQKGTFSEAAIHEILREILHVLEFVHAHGSIHRDIKPSNIMRRRDGRLYLLDFGAVKQVTKVPVGTTTGSTGIYSAGYAPPEQTGRGTVYPSTDLFALAVTCLELLTGEEPNNLYDSFNNTWIWHNRARMSPRLTQVLDRMLMPVPNQRFQSATEALAALQAVSTSKSTQMQPPGGTVSSGAVTIAPPPTPPPTPAPAPPTVAPSPPPPVQRRASMPTFSMLELLGGAAFTGFEGALLAIALFSLLGTTVLSGGFWIVLLAGLFFVQIRRIIEGFDLPIIAGITFALVVFVGPLNRFIGALTPYNPLLPILLVAVLAGLGAIALTALFRLVYNLVSRLLG